MKVFVDGGTGFSRGIILRFSIGGLSAGEITYAGGLRRLPGSVSAHAMASSEWIFVMFCHQSEAAITMRW